MLLEKLIPALFCQCSKIDFQEHSALYQTPYNVMTFYLLVKTCKLVVAILACGLLYVLFKIPDLSQKWSACRWKLLWLHIDLLNLFYLNLLYRCQESVNKLPKEWL